MRSPEAVPVIDIRGLEENPSVQHALADACEHWGFFQVIEHGLSPDLLASLQSRMRAFFSLPAEDKLAIERTAENAWGFYDKELTKNVRDLKEIFDYGPDGSTGAGGNNRAQWPPRLPDFRPVVQEFYAACETLSFRLLSAIARNLGTPPGDLLSSFTPRHTSFLRLNYYPVAQDHTDPKGAAESPRFGVNHHTDAGALTLLLQDDTAGLQVLREGEWFLVAPRLNALVVNIGDIVQVWSNDRYRAAVHRVLASRAADRCSAPFFFNPGYDVTYQPLPSVLGPDHPARYRPIRWGEFRAARAAGDYADQGEEIQIADFRTG